MTLPTRSLLCLLLLLVLSVLAACSAPRATSNPDADPHANPHVAPYTSAGISVTHAPLAPAASVPPASRTLEAYKADVARHIVGRNPEHVFEGVLPPLLPAIVVVNITVDRDGRLHNAQVQRSRDPGASQVALAALRRSGLLPRPEGLQAAQSNLMTFSETFLFGVRYRYQLRTLAGPQSSGL